MTLIVDLRNAILRTGEISGGGSYSIQQYQILKKHNPYLLISHESQKRLFPPKTNFIISNKANNFLNNNSGVFISGIPYDIYKFNLINWRVIITVHGLRYLEEPHDFLEPLYSKSLKHFLISCFKTFFPFFYKRFRLKQYKRLFGLGCKNLKIITVSSTSKSSIENHIPGKNIEVLFPFSEINNLTKPKSINQTESYFVILNSNRWVKNYIRGYLGLKKFNKKTGQNIKLKATGKPSYFIRAFFSREVEFLGYVSENDLDDLVANSIGLIYPSLNEGFGYPPLRALFLSKKIYSSNLPVLSEIYGNALTYFNPFDPSDICRSFFYTSNEDKSNVFYAVLKKQENAKKDFESIVKKWLIK